MATSTRAAAARVFHGWWIVSGAVALQALVAGLFLQAYGVYAAFWMAEFGWSRTTVSLAYALHRTESGLLGPLHGWLLQRASPRAVILAGVMILGLGFVALAAVQSFVALLAVFLLMAVGASLAGILSLTTVIVNWFERRRARAMSLLAMGLSLGGLAVPLVTIAAALLTVTTTATVVVAAVLHGLSWGLRGPLTGAMRADYFGRAAFSMIMGTSSLIVMMGSVGGPLLAGLMADAQGDYRGALLTLSGIALAGAAAFFSLQPPPNADDAPPRKGRP